MPDPAEIDRLVRQLYDRRDHRKAVEAAHERVFDRLAEAPGEGQELRRAQNLIAKEHDQMVEQRAADFGDRLGRQLARQLDAEDLGADRAGDGVDFDPGRHLDGYAARW